MEERGKRLHSIEPTDNRAAHRPGVGVEEASSARKAISLASRDLLLDKRYVDQAIVAFSDDNAISQQYNQLAVALAVGAEHQPLKRLLVASPHAGDGRTTVVLNLACALAQANKRVLVVDCDLACPSIHRALGVEPPVGLVEVLLDAVPLTTAVTKVYPWDFDILPTCAPVENSMRVLSSPSFREVVATLDHFYDFILFDPPPLKNAISHLLVHLTDSVLLVIRAGKTSSSELAKAVAPLKEENLFGVVLNRMSKA